MAESPALVGELRSLTLRRAADENHSFSLQLTVDREDGVIVTAHFEEVTGLELAQHLLNVPIALAVHDHRRDGWEDGARYRASDLEQDGPLSFFCSAFSLSE